jgi:hypothetical protein
MGAHGGAGVSTLITLLNHEQDEKTAVEYDGSWPEEHRLALVARSTASGAEYAAQRIAQWPKDAARPSLLLVADAPFPIPSLARHRFTAISETVSRILFVPYVFALRNLGPGRQCLQDAEIVRLARRLQRALLLPDAER